MATSTTAPPTRLAQPPLAIRIPAHRVPPRIARKVPISTNALPPTSSSSSSAWGRIEYLTGPNSADWVPMANSTTSNSGKLPNHRPRAPSSMIATSPSLMRRISRSLSNFSPNCPPSAENRKNGKMNSSALRLISRSRSALKLSLNRIARISACLNRLSLKAPSNWLVKKGRKRLLPSKRNCECSDMALRILPVYSVQRAAYPKSAGSGTEPADKLSRSSATLP